LRSGATGAARRRPRVTERRRARFARRGRGTGAAGARSLNMQKLVEGIHHFQTGVFGSQREFFEKLVSGQRPMALFITCSDSRISPNLITQSEPGDLFIMRNAGNIVPPHGAAAGGGEAATIEFAVAELGVPDIIVCGHTHCGAMKALIGQPGSLDNMPATRSWLGHAESTRRIMRDKYDHLQGAARVTACVEENVLVQLENLRTHPVVAAGMAQRKLNLHGWVYKLETGEVFAYDTEAGQFEPLRRHRTPVGMNERPAMTARAI
jgi:carbonic anhydrase